MQVLRKSNFQAATMRLKRYWRLHCLYPPIYVRPNKIPGVAYFGTNRRLTEGEGVVTSSRGASVMLTQKASVIIFPDGVEQSDLFVSVIIISTFVDY